mmetsp:Transcript_30288/g.61795  ORF Transcript_30288/g.61795 Transcript_30288/m.61795 type:complete len:646 (+) Transcript_30288:117-2054(+)
MSKQSVHKIRSDGPNDEDIDSSSLLAQAHTAREESSIRCMSDWESNAGVEGTVDSSLLPSRKLRDGVAEINADDDDYTGEPIETNSHHGRSRRESRLFRWWSNVVSRVSRSASSLLSQHSPNLTDILDGNEENPLGKIEERRSQQASSLDDGNVSCGAIGLERVEEQDIYSLREEVEFLKKRIAELKSSNKVDEATAVKEEPSRDSSNIPVLTPVQTLRPDQISRYSRQLLLNDGFGVEGQKKLLSTSALVIGAGGIGSTVLLYLAAAGVGHITIVDYDCVEMSNLHRQIIHRDENASNSFDQVGMNKALSAKQTVVALNPTISCTAVAVMIDGSNALELVSRHDVIIDACDNPRTRYLLNDACVLAGKTLVSGSAMGTEGQLTVYNYLTTQEYCCENDSDPEKTTGNNKSSFACYRCLYPNPVPSEGSKSCSDNGVLGPVPGIIGVLQAVEALKVLTGIGKVMHDRLMMYDCLHCSFMNIKKPLARRNCAVCSQHATIRSMKDSEISLANVRGPACDTHDNNMPTLSSEQSISCSEYNKIRENGTPHVLLDVRVPRQYDMCALEGSVNLPLGDLESKLEQVGDLSHGELPVFCICRRGIASAEATRVIRRAIDEQNQTRIHSVHNISGGLNSWVRTVNSEFPQY